MAAKKKSVEVTDTTVAIADVKVETKAPSALDALRALGQKKPAPAGSPTIVMSLTDPAIQGASKSGSTVKLGFDPAFAESAKHCAQLNEALVQAQSEFGVLQSQVRDYGAKKRVMYNDLFKSDAVTVNVPYTVDAGPGQSQTKYVQVICTNKYSVQQDVIKNNKVEIGEFYGRLFEETETRTLKPNAEELIRNLLSEMGIVGEALDTTMDNLRDVSVSVKAKADYEKEARAVPEAIKTILDQGVKRQQPGLKFPD